MNFSVFWTDTAQGDLSALVEHIAQDSPQNARIIFHTIRERARNLNHFPQRGNPAVSGITPSCSAAIM
jgi:plasmid stabilization system protein ParE